MQGRIEQLEARVGEGQSEAKRLMGLGQKAQRSARCAR